MNRQSNRLLKAAGCAACLTALLAALGGHWLVLQSIAWARMISAYSQQESLASALFKTFDGKHPCALCLVIQHGKSSEKKADQQKPVEKIDGLLPVHHLALRGAAAYPAVVPPRQGFNEWPDPPPTPPPRAA